MFDTIVMVDWSAANMPRTGRDSIWMCRQERAAPPTLVNLDTRHATKVLLGEWLAAARAAQRRVLVGFDFPFGYPAGFAARLGLAGPPWRALWNEIARLVEDDERNANNRFAVAAALNRRASQGPFPFWGCPAAHRGAFLGSKHHRRHGADGLAERRLIDEYMRGAQPCWKLFGAGSVGGQVLTGIPVVRALRDDPRWCDAARVWPFETGLAAPLGADIVFAEVYPSLWAVSPAPGEAKDAAQVRTVVDFFSTRAGTGELAALFAGDPRLTPEQRRLVEDEEAWTLGVTAAGQNRLSAPTTGSGSHHGSRPRSGGRPEGGERTPDGQRPALSAPKFAYIRDPAEITRRSLARVRAQADYGRVPHALRPLALRIAQAAGDAAVLDRLASSRGAVAAGRRALAAGAPILVDSTMTAAGIARERLPAHNEVVCRLHDPSTVSLAAADATTRSAAAVGLWRQDLAGAVVAIGNAPTALFRLLEMIAGGAPQPALVLGFPVGFVGAAEAKAALAQFGHGLAYVTLHGSRGGSAMAAAAVNALAAAG